MKKYRGLMIVSVIIYLLLAGLVGLYLAGEGANRNRWYKVEINRIQAEVIQRRAAEPETWQNGELSIEGMNFSKYRGVRAVSFLKAGESDTAVIDVFYEGIDSLQSEIRPVYADGGIAGYLRFDYEESGWQPFVVVELCLLGMELSLLAILFHLYRHLVKPFDRMQELTYELSKGNLRGDIKAEKNRYLGHFLWGLNALRDALLVSKKRELELLKQKKLLVFSLSHDIKTPLNTISLYSRALEEGLYGTKKQQQEVFHQIGEKADEIERYVDEIVKSSHEDILDIQVEPGEFYLQDLMEKVLSVYGEKCSLRKVDLFVEAYENQLLRGDIQRVLEVFENIFENAFKYGDGRKIMISFEEEDYCKLIRVFNTGEPVSENDFSHLFESFFRGENTNRRQGNGLGLYICKEILHKMDGEIFAECLPDGMAFVVVLPM